MLRSLQFLLLLSLAAGTPALAQTRLGRPVTLPRKDLGSRLVTIPAVQVTKAFPNGGEMVDFYFDAYPNATGYALRRGTSAAGPFAPLPAGQVSWALANYSRSPICCEGFDRLAYQAGAGTTLWYVIDALAGSTVIGSSAPIQVDLPAWFRGPLSVDIVKTGTNQWTIGWESVSQAQSYTVLLRLGSAIIAYQNLNIPPTQSQVNINGLYSGNTYQLQVYANIPYNGTVLQRAGNKSYTAP